MSGMLGSVWDAWGGGMLYESVFVYLRVKCIEFARPPSSHAASDIALVTICRVVALLTLTFPPSAITICQPDTPGRALHPGGEDRKA